MTDVTLTAKQELVAMPPKYVCKLCRRSFFTLHGRDLHMGSQACNALRKHYAAIDWRIVAARGYTNWLKLVGIPYTLVATCFDDCGYARAERWHAPAWACAVLSMVHLSKVARLKLLKLCNADPILLAACQVAATMGHREGAFLLTTGFDPEQRKWWSKKEWHTHYCAYGVKRWAK